MGMKKLSTIFMRYILLVAGGIVLLLAFNIGTYALCINMGIILPTVEIERQMITATEKLQSSDKLDFNDVPFFCEYALFSDDGILQTSSTEEDTAESFWIINIVNQKDAEKPYRYEAIQRDGNVLILRYRIASQFKNTLLRRMIPAADLLVIVVILCEIIGLLIFISYLFGKYTGKKIKQLLVVAQKIEKQDLNFRIEKSGIFEIDHALDALEHMKQALKKSLAEQWQADKMQQDQISALAHDLKTPLTIIRGNTELLYDTKLTNEQKECVHYIINSSCQMQNYVQMIIETTKYNLPFRAIKINAAEFLSDVKMQAQGLCAIKNICLEWQEDYNAVQLLIDNEQLLRAVVNVFSNAVEHTPNYGTIKFSATDDKEYFNMTVRDTGIGFSPEELKRATEQFYMGDSSRTSNAHYGIGLYIVKLIVTKHNGKLILGNNTESQGAAVTIKIPR